MEAYDLFDRTLTVSEANGLIHDTVEEMFYDLSIEGEISGFRPASSGHWYFTLKDSAAAIDSAVFRSAQFSMMIPSNGDLVIAKGSLSYYTKTGRLTFVIREMKKKGDGSLMEIIEKRKAYYRSLGYFDEDIKKPIPEEIEKLGVVTSPTGAAIRDILNVTKRRAPSLDIILFPAAVQGEGAAEEIAMRIRQANIFEACSVLIVGRGGGSQEDLSAFSEPEVIEAIHNSVIPVISAVGHEIDWPISDYVADKRAPTPSAAAEIVTETIFRRRERLEKALSLSSSLLKERLADATMRLRECMHKLSQMENKVIRYRGRIPSTEDLRKLLLLRVQNAETRLAYSQEGIEESLKARLASASISLEKAKKATTENLILKAEKARLQLTSSKKEINHIFEKILKEKEAGLKAVIKENEALSPLAVLSRGYSVTMDGNGKIIRNKKDAVPGSIIRTRLTDGILTSVVKEG